MADNADNTLTAESRTVVGSRPAGRLRREGKVPAVMYGLETDTANLTVPGRELTHILAGESGANTLITLKVDGEEHLALARQIQRHPTRGDALPISIRRRWTEASPSCSPRPSTTSACGGALSSST